MLLYAAKYSHMSFVSREIHTRQCHCTVCFHNYLLSL